MKKIFLAVIIIISIFLIGCVNLDEYVSVDKYNQLKVAFDEAIDDYSSLKEENNSLKTELNNLGNEINLSEEENIKYANLLANLNDLLSNVYYGYASNDKWILDGFTAFSLEYKGKYYLITAGHCIENEYGKFVNFKYKANFSNEWIYPKLLVYEVDRPRHPSIDYAVFYSDKISKGLKIDYDNNNSKFILGAVNNNLNVLRTEGLGKNGESGSPIIDLDGEVVDIYTGFFTDIDLVIEAIDNLK